MIERRRRTKEPTAAPSKSGIKVRKIGATWWGQRWIEALEHMSRDYLNRLGRGRSYAREGRVHDLKVDSGTISALVTGSEPDPYKVTLRIAMLPPASWKNAIEAMSRQALFAAELLSGQMPRDIDQAFRAAGHSLFPAKQREIETDCSCSDWANPCKHVAAVHYVLGEAFDKDPFLLFELRGRTKKQVLGALSALRSGAPEEQLVATVAARAERREASTTTVEITARNPEDFEKPSAALPLLQFSVTPPANGGLLSQIGAPASWAEEEMPYAALPELYRAAGQLARDLALRSPASVNSIGAPIDILSEQKGLRTK
jgi:uncharacterized Zn finger protein